MYGLLKVCFFFSPVVFSSKNPDLMRQWRLSIGRWRMWNIPSLPAFSEHFSRVFKLNIVSTVRTRVCACSDLLAGWLASPGFPLRFSLCLFDGLTAHNYHRPASSQKLNKRGGGNFKINTRGSFFSLLLLAPGKLYKNLRGPTNLFQNLSLPPSSLRIVVVVSGRVFRPGQTFEKVLPL